MFDKLKKLKIKREYLFVIILTIAVIIIVFSTFYDKNSTEQTVSLTNNYVEVLEQKLTKSIKQINGVKTASVIINVECGITTVIAEDVKKTEENGNVTFTSSPVLVGGEPIVLGEIYPKIVGVIVICDCDDNVLINSYVLDVVTTVLDVPCEKVKILTQ